MASASSMRFRAAASASSRHVFAALSASASRCCAADSASDWIFAAFWFAVSTIALASSVDSAIFCSRSCWSDASASALACRICLLASTRRRSRSCWALKRASSSNRSVSVGVAAGCGPIVLTVRATLMGRATGVAAASGVSAAGVAISGCMVVLHFGQRREGMGASSVSVEPQFGQTCLTDIGMNRDVVGDNEKRAPLLGGGSGLRNHQ